MAPDLTLLSPASCHKCPTVDPGTHTAYECGTVLATDTKDRHALLGIKLVLLVLIDASHSQLSLDGDQWRALEQGTVKVVSASSTFCVSLNGNEVELEDGSYWLLRLGLRKFLTRPA